MHRIDRLGFTTPQLEQKVLRKVVSLTEDKIRQLLVSLKIEGIQREISRLMLRLKQENMFLDDSDRKFRQWIAKLPQLASLANDADLNILMSYIKWASEARWVYSEELKALCSSSLGHMPKWINIIYKLGRYCAATRSLIKLAYKQPDLITAIKLQAVTASPQQSFSLKGSDELLPTLKRLSKHKHEEVKATLGQTWAHNDPEVHFRKACRHKLTLHAEMQLLGFYSQHRDHTPSLLFMGTSKKACYLCYKFISEHPSGISVSACHQKIYPSWMPPPCPSSQVKLYKRILNKILQQMEKTATRDLKTRLGERRPANLDSTAGPSLTILSGRGLSLDWDDA